MSVPRYGAPDGSITIAVRGRWVAIPPPPDLTQVWTLCIGGGSPHPYWKKVNAMPVYIEGDGAAHSGTPTAAAGSNAGTTPPVPIVAAASRDFKGSLTFGTGAGAGVVAGDHLVDLTFAAAFDAPPQVVVLTAANQITAALTLYVSNVTATGFSIGSNTNPAKLQAPTKYAVDYMVVP